MSTPALAMSRMVAALTAGGVAFDSVSIGTTGQSSTVKVLPASQQALAQPIIDAFDWSQSAQDAFDLAQARTGTTGLTTTPIQQQPLAALVRAVVLLALDEFNTHTANSNAILAAAAAATSLADFKTRMGLIANLPVRTKAQLLAAMTAKIGAGDTDS